MFMVLVVEDCSESLVLCRARLTTWLARIFAVIYTDLSVHLCI